MQPDNDCTAALKRQLDELRNATTENIYLAEMGYMAYAVTTDRKNYRGESMPVWENLPGLQKQAWVNAASAIRRRVVNNKFPAE